MLTLTQSKSESQHISKTLEKWKLLDKSQNSKQKKS